MSSKQSADRIQHIVKMGGLSKSSGNNGDETPLYDASLLKEINWDDRKANFKNGVSITNPGENLRLRPLCMADYDRGFLQILGELTLVGDVSRETFKSRYEEMKASKNTYYVTVIEDITTNQIIGAASLILEQKFIHSASLRGRIEDVVVSDLYRGKQLGKLLVEALTLLGKHLGCYKMSLECSEENRAFYENFGYSKDPGNFMIQRYKD